MATINITPKADLTRNDKFWASQIASIIQQQMTYPNRVIFWSWGAPVSYTHLTLPTTAHSCRSRWSPYH